MTLSATEQSLIITAFMVGMSWVFILWGWSDKAGDGWQYRMGFGFLSGVAVGWVVLAALGLAP
jgi:hypothetical protein